MAHVPQAQHRLSLPLPGAPSTAPRRSLLEDGRPYTTVAIALGAVLLVTLFPQTIASPVLFGVLLVLACATSAWTLHLPGLREGSAMASAYAVEFTALLLLGPRETMMVAAARACCHSLYRSTRPSDLQQTLLSMASAIIAVHAAGVAYTWLGGDAFAWRDHGMTIRPLVGAAVAYFVFNTGIIATAVALSTRQTIDRVWAEQFLWTAPTYVVGAAAAALTMWVVDAFPSRWLVLLGGVPIYLAYRAYKAYLRRIQEGERRAHVLADLHLATIEALALAIDAKNQRSPSHIKRVQRYAVALGRALGMSDHDVQGLETAALLHDIGNLAVPEHILAKSGPLTPEETQKVRAHPVVGADIVSSVPFPYPVTPLILSHHERWDGKGYPSGLKGEEAPLGARVLAVVNHFNGATTARPNQVAESWDQAALLLQEEAGKALDPTIVATFLKLLPSLEALAAPPEDVRSETSRPDQAASAPATAGALTEAAPTFFEHISRSQREIYALYDIAQAMGTSVGVSDTMALITSKLSSLVPYSCVALFLEDEETGTLKCRYVTGIDADIIQQLIVPKGKGITGWVARNRRSMVNAPPSADFDAAGVVNAGSSLKSALICPLISGGRLIGTLAVYHVERAFFQEDHQRLLDQVCEQAAAVINNSILFDQTQADSLTDTLTGLPNTRHLFTHLTGELARARRLGTEVALLIMDLDSFKEINDSHGHHVGDRALCEVAKVLRAAIRPYDLCVRYAGDEFIVVLSGCSIEEAQIKRAELQRDVSQVQLEVRPGFTLPLGISVGIAIFSRDGDSYETLLATADSRMYQDKAGRKQRSVRSETAVVLHGKA